MEFSNAGLFGDGAQPQQQAQPVARRGAQPQSAGLPANVAAMIQGLAAQVRQLTARVAQLEGAAQKLAANDKKTANYVNGLAGLVGGIDKTTRGMVANLRTFARGGGVQAQQFVPRASDAVVAYSTPQPGGVSAQPFQPATGGAPNAEPVDPGSDATQPMTDYDRIFFSGEED